MGIIDEWLRIRVMGAVFKVWVVEYHKAWPRHSWWKELMSFEEGMSSNLFNNKVVRRVVRWWIRFWVGLNLILLLKQICLFNWIVGLKRQDQRNSGKDFG